MPLRNLNEAPVFNGTITFNDTVQFSKGADIASANALALGDDGNYFDVTGTTAITSIGTTGHVGTWVKLHFDGILTLTHHATDLVLPTGANIATAAGDEAEFVEYASGDWRCTSYTRADGTALAGSGGASNLMLNFTPSMLEGIETNFAALTKITGTTNGRPLNVRTFDDTTEQYVSGTFQAPADLDASGTVAFRAYVTPATAASANTAWTFGHDPVADGEDWDDGTWTDEDSGAVAMDTNDDYLTLVEWTETVSNLGWAAKDNIIFRLSRDVGTDNLSGDLYLVNFTIEIPVA